MRNLFEFVKLTIILMVVACVVALTFSCATVKKVVRNINDIATDYCVYVLNEQDIQPDGISIEDICAIQRNVDYFVDILLRDKNGSIDIDRVIDAGVTDNNTEAMVTPDQTGQGVNLLESGYDVNYTNLPGNSEGIQKQRRTGQGVM